MTIRRHVGFEINDFGRDSIVHNPIGDELVAPEGYVIRWYGKNTLNSKRSKFLGEGQVYEIKKGHPRFIYAVNCQPC